MIDSPELREQCAASLLTATDRVRESTAFVGLDGFIDQIIHVVDTRENSEQFRRLPSISSLGQRIAEAAGRSTNIELVIQLTKLGGNGPIMANALASLGLQVTYVGALGYPTIHPVFEEFTRRADVHSIAPAGQTDALEFDDGKVMLTKTVQLNEITWANLLERFGRDAFAQKFARSDLIAFVNWTMIPYMSDVWEAIQKELAPSLEGPRRKMFFDLADPEKRTEADLRRALELIAQFEQYFDVTLGLNEKEANEVAQALGLEHDAHDSDALCALASELSAKIPVSTLLVHPVQYAIAVTQGKLSAVKGLWTAKPRITTGAGDHFNAGFCVGKMLGLDNPQSLLAGVTTSGHYVRTGQSPSVGDLAAQLRAWPNEW